LGVAFFAPPTDIVRRRALAGVLAIAANSLFIALLLFLPRPPDPRESPAALDVVFVSPPPRPEPASEPATAPPSRTEPEPPEPEPAAEAAAPVTPAVPPPSAEAESDEDDDAETPAEPARVGGAAATGLANEVLPYPAGPGSTEFAVREIFCLSTSDANRDALRCPPPDGSEGLPMLQYASPENLAKAEAAFAELTQAQIRALFAGRGLPVRDLAGQPTLADPSSRPTSSADQMRDTLPPLIPDPAFGD
jgi:type IV secretory pathway VirB10-like protein